MIEQVFEYNQHFVAMMNVINAARLNPPTKGHKHHIIPRCWFKMNNLPIDNSDENLVLLTKEQHAKIHKLMYLCVKDGRLKRSMALATHLLNLPATFLNYTHTKETRQKISEAKKGKVLSEEARKNRAELRNGLTPFKDRHHSAETIKKISESHKGKVFSEEHRRKLSEAHKGKNTWNKGKKMPFAGKTWKLIDGKRVWILKETK